MQGFLDSMGMADDIQSNLKPEQPEIPMRSLIISHSVVDLHKWVVFMGLLNMV